MCNTKNNASVCKASILAVLGSHYFKRTSQLIEWLKFKRIGTDVVLLSPLPPNIYPIYLFIFSQTGVCLRT